MIDPASVPFKDNEEQIASPRIGVVKIGEFSKTTRPVPVYEDMDKVLFENDNGNRVSIDVKYLSNKGKSVHDKAEPFEVKICPC